MPTYEAMRAFTAARRRDAGRTLALRTPAGVHPGTGRPGRPRADAGRHPGGRHQPRRPGDLPRSGPGGGLPAGRPAPRRLLRQGVRLPDRGGGDPHPGALRRHRPPVPARRASTCGWTIRSRMPRSAAPRPQPDDRQLPRPGQDRRAGHQGQPTLHLPRRGAQRGHGPGTLLAHQPLWLCRPADGGPFYNRRIHHLGRGGAGAGPQARRLLAP